MRVELEAHGAEVHLDVDPNDHIGRIIVASGRFYERDLLEDARKRVPPGGLAVDVGAHVGNHTLWFAQVCGMRVLALEPNPDTYQRLLRNLALNFCEARALPVAAGAKNGRGTLFPGRAGNTGTASVARDGRGGVPIVPLDDLAEQADLIKIDTEGSAVEVLRGATRLLRDCRPVVYAEGERSQIARALPRGYRCFGRFARTPTWGFQYEGVPFGRDNGSPQAREVHSRAAEVA